MKVLIAGIATRGMVTSAVAAGYDVTSLDYFADSDQPKEAKCLSLERDFHCSLTLKNLARAIKILLDEIDTVVFCAGMENETSLFDSVKEKLLLGNEARVVTGVRDTRKLELALRGTNVRIPKTIFPGESLPLINQSIRQRWLCKDSLYSGGQGIYEWDGRCSLKKREILQLMVEGKLASASFVANRRSASLLGLSVQYAGVEDLGANNYWWCGNVLPLIDESVVSIIQDAANALTNYFGLVGLNGIDFIISGGEINILEINPRYTESMELIEMAIGKNLFNMQVEAYHGKLPQFELINSCPFFGKGVLYAERDVTIMDTNGWQYQDRRDIPHSGSTILLGAPICSIMAVEDSPDTCWASVLTKAQHIKNEIYKDMRL